MNFIFISPHFPHTYWNFCARLKKNGANVLGIGDAPYASLSGELRSCLTEYYYVPDMRRYEDMFRAVAYFSFKYGKIDWIESNNEYWLENDARLRTDFHVTTGFQTSDMDRVKRKSVMKAYFAKADVPSARQVPVTTLEAARAFVRKVGFPVIVKPDVGVGASSTYKLADEAALEAFFHGTEITRQAFVMEEFVSGQIFSYDAIVNSTGKILFESSTSFPPSMMDVVNQQLELSYCIQKTVPAQLRRRGRATLKAFGVRSRFVHFEFFKLDRDTEGLGRKGDFVALEVNMRPAGGYTPDMMDWAHSTDVYQIWADMVVFDENRKKQDGSDHFCLYVARRDRFAYRLSSEQIKEKYRGRILMSERMPEAISNDLGNEFFIVNLDDRKELEAFTKDILAKA